MRAASGMLLALAVLVGCAEDGKVYAGLDFDVQSAPPIRVSVQSDRIELVAGVAVKIGAEPLSHDERYGKRDRVTLRADNPDILAVFVGESDDSDTSPREFVLVGLRTGDSCLSVSINGDFEECIPVHVVADRE
jgi:hypothetical protein